MAKEDVKEMSEVILGGMKCIKVLMRNYLAESVNKNSFNKTIFIMSSAFFSKIYPANNGKNFKLVAIKDNFIAKSEQKKIGNDLIGLYYFTIEFKNNEQDLEVFFEDWNEHSTGASSFPPKNINSNERKIRRNATQKEYLLYLGKSETNLKRRIGNHLLMNKIESPKTSSLRLKEFIEKYNEKYEIKFGYLSLGRNENNKNVDEVASLLYTLERELRMTFPPLLGRAR